MSLTSGRDRSVPPWRFVVALGCFAVATILAVRAISGQPDLPFDFVLPQPPADPVVSRSAEDSLQLLRDDEGREKALERSRELSAQANAPSERPPRERLIEIPELPPEVAAHMPPLPEVFDPAVLSEEEQP